MSRLRAAAFLILLFPVLWPVTELYLAELIKPSSWAAVKNDAAFAAMPRLLFSSCLIALLAALLASLMALAHFMVIKSLPRSCRFAWIALAAIPLFIPTHLLGLAWIQAIGRAGWITAILTSAGLPSAWLPSILYSSFGCAAILASHFFPLVLGALLLGWRAGDAAMIESLRLYLAPSALWRHALLGWLRPWLAAGFVAVFSLALLDYIVPFLLARRVFAVEILTSFSLDYLPGKAAVLSLPLLLLSGSGFAFAARLLRRTNWTLSTRNEAELPQLPRPTRNLLFTASAILLLFASALPLGTFFVWAGSLESYSKIWASSDSQIAASLIWTLLAATLATFLALLSPLTRLRASLFLPLLLALPGSILGVAHIRFWNRASPGDLLGAIYDSGLMLPLGLIGVIFPVAFMLVSLRRRQTPAALTDLARLNGTHRNPRAQLITSAHFMLPAAFIALWTGFILAMQESHASVLLVAPGQETLAIRTTTLLHFAPDSLLAALCLIALGLMFVVSAAMLMLGWLAHRLGTHYAERILLD